MRLLVKEKGQPDKELMFENGPIYIGRQMGSQVFLPNRSISRQHAVICSSKNKWTIEDLDSANKTYLNKHAIHKSELKNGDTIKIGCFNIKILLGTDQESPPKPSIHLDDTISEDTSDISIETRPANSKNAPMIKLPAKRTEDLFKAYRALNNVRSLKNLHTQLLDVILDQFAPLNAFVALRQEDSGPMDIESGRKISSETIKRSDLLAADKINEAIETRHYVLVPKMPKCKIRSAIITPIFNGKHCRGYLYANNSTMHESYSMTDLDYLMIISILAAAKIENV